MGIKKILKKSAAWLLAMTLLLAPLNVRAALLEGIDFWTAEQDETAEKQDSCGGAEIPPAPEDMETDSEAWEEESGSAEWEEETDSETWEEESTPGREETEEIQEETEETDTAQDETQEPQSEKGVPVLADTNGDTEVHLFAPRDRSFPVGTMFRLLTVPDMAKEQQETDIDTEEQCRRLEDSLKSMWEEGAEDGQFFPYYLLVADSAGQEFLPQGEMEVRVIFRDKDFYKAVCSGTCSFRAASQGKGNEYIEITDLKLLRDDGKQTVTVVLKTEKTGWLCILRSDAPETETESELWPETETETESELWPETETETESELWPETETESGLWPEAETETESGLWPEIETESEPWPEIMTTAASSSSGSPVTSAGSGFVKMDMANIDGSYRASRWYSGISSFSMFNSAGASVVTMERDPNIKVYYPLNDTAKGKFGVIYHKILYQDNVWYDMKITVADYTNQVYTSPKGEMTSVRPPIGFLSDDIAYHFKCDMGEVLLKVEYFRNGDAAQTPQKVDTRFQWWDIDNMQRFGIRLGDGSMQAKYYQTNECKVHWLNQTAEVDGKRYLVVTAWDSYDGNTYAQGNVGFALSGCSNYYVLIGERDRIKESNEARKSAAQLQRWAGRLKNGTLGSLQLGILLQTDVETPVPLDHAYPQKAVSNDGAAWSSANVLPGIASVYYYRIRQYVPWESSANYFSQFTVTDALPQGVDYAGPLTVRRVEDNADVTGNFTVSTANDTVTVSPTAAYLKNAGMYGYTFDIVFKVKFDAQETTAQYQGNTASCHVSNGASVRAVFAGSGTVCTGESNKVDTTASVDRKTQQAPVKCLDGNESLKEKELASFQDTIVFSVCQTVPENAAAWLPSRMVFTDTLADCLEYLSGKVYRRDVGGYVEDGGWKVSVSGQTVKAEKAFQPSGTTYRLDITCKVRDGYDMTAYRKVIGNRNWYVIANTAEVELAWNSGSPQSVKQQTNAASVRVNDGPVRVRLTLTKEIDTADIVWAHGNPTFIFQVYGEDLDGKKHTYYEAVEFTKENAGSGEKAALTAEFEVPAGWYTAVEEKTMRYRLNSIYSVAGGSASGEKAVFDLSAGKDGFATFYNVKTTDEGESHSAFVRNVIRK